MKANSKNKLAQLDIADLLAGVTDTVAKDPSNIDVWIKEQELRPGTARIHVQELYDAYREWAAQHGDIKGKTISKARFGRELQHIGRRVHSTTGTFYYTCWGVRGRGQPDSKAGRTGDTAARELAGDDEGGDQGE